MKSKNALLDTVRNYYDACVREHGPCARGVDWKDEVSQGLRFDVLSRIFKEDPPGSVIDLGCGYGAYLKYLRDSYKFSGHYLGLDLSHDMIRKAPSIQNAQFRQGTLMPDDRADYIVASGIFNVHMGTPEAQWQEYILETLDMMNACSTKGFSFNAMTKYVDFEDPKLFYADPCALFDHCKTHYARNVALYHDYGFYEFTIAVWKD